MTPSYSQRPYIAETIERVLPQEGDFAIEYVVMDGGSTANERWQRAIRASGRRRYEAAAALVVLGSALFPPLLWRRGQYQLFELTRRLAGSELLRRLLALRPLPPRARSRAFLLRRVYACRE